MSSHAHALRSSPSLKGHLHIGGTPLVRIPGLTSGAAEIWAKLEWAQAGGSVKARAAHQIIRKAIQDGSLRQGVALLDASSGNTAIAYATLLQHHGLRTVICLPANASSGRIETLRALGAELVLTSPFEGTEGAQTVARQLYSERPEKYFYADQYSNPANWQAHFHGTAEEIIAQSNGRVTHFVAGLGTTGTFTGTARKLKMYRRSIRTIALQPDGPMHGLEGWKHLPTASVPAIFDASLPDEVHHIDSGEAYEMIRFIHRQEGLLISPSAAANLVGARAVAAKLDEGMVVTVLPDTLERYEEVAQQIFGQSRV